MFYLIHGEKIIKFDAANFEENVLKQKIGQLMISDQLVIDNPYNQIDERIADTYGLFNSIKNVMCLNGNILILDDDEKQIIARFISYYQCFFLKSGSVTVWSSKIKSRKYDNIDFIERTVCYEQDDFSHFDCVIVRNPKRKLVDALTCMANQDIAFYVETEFPWGIERFEEKYLEKLYDDDPDFLYTSAMDKLYKYISKLSYEVKCLHHSVNATHFYKCKSMSKTDDGEPKCLMLRIDDYLKKNNK